MLETAKPYKKIKENCKTDINFCQKLLAKLEKTCTPLKSLSNKFFRREAAKNTKLHRIANPKTLFEFCRKPEAQSEIEQKPQKTSKPKN